MSRRAIIAVAPNGARVLRQHNAAVPITPLEIAEEVAACARAGAAIAHVHARHADGTPSQAVETYAEILRLIRERCNIIVQVSIGVRGFDLEEALRPIVLRPEMASFPLRALRSGEGEDRLADLVDMAGRMRAAGVRPELDASDVPMLEAGLALLARGAVAEPPCFGLMVGEAPTARATIRGLLDLAERLPEGAHWWAGKGGRWQIELRAAALAMGGHLRVGFEDSVLDRAGDAPAPNNAYWVEQAVDLAQALGREPATPAEARAMLSMS
ncbi:3-keto-5-aminohexanoate cleavage protein [Roseomonas sp. BN140053]|uniref:3-keto-5-aminohexanoate cleavage protein n=1 Tax=Roseomonas sp. BN140053 TaxID=3391898 RepID=UPI0039EA4139